MRRLPVIAVVVLVVSLSGCTTPVSKEKEHFWNLDAGDTEFLHLGAVSRASFAATVLEHSGPDVDILVLDPDFTPSGGDAISGEVGCAFTVSDGPALNCDVGEGVWWLAIDGSAFGETPATSADGTLRLDIKYNGEWERW